MNDDPKTTVATRPPDGPVVPADNSQTAAVAIYGGSALAYFCSVPLDDVQRDEVLMKCAFAPDHLLKDKVGQVIRLKHVYGTRVSITNASTGEVEEATHTVLIDHEGITYACTSKGVAKSVALLLQSKGMPDRWPAPILVQVIRVKARIGDMLALKVLPNDTPKPKKS